MDGKTIRDKLVGSDDERAVSPVIGVILMVAITVILAAVIATLVMDFGDSTEAPINAQVNAETDSNGNVTLTVVEAGDAENFYLRGAANGNQVALSGETGAAVEVDLTNFGLSSSDEGDEVNIVATAGDREETAGDFEVPGGSW